MLNINQPNDSEYNNKLVIQSMINEEKNKNGNLIGLNSKNLVNIFLVNALRNKDEKAIQNILDILVYAFSNKTEWLADALAFALEYNNYGLANKLLNIQLNEK